MTALGRWNFIEPGDVVALHTSAMTKFGGQDSEPSKNCVESSVDNAMNAAFYQDEAEEPDLLIGVAYLLCYLAKNHCFLDGNKRTAWAAIVHLFWVNDIIIVADEEEAAALVDRVATSKDKAPEVIAWLQEPGRLSAR